MSTSTSTIREFRSSRPKELRQERSNSCIIGTMKRREIERILQDYIDEKYMGRIPEGVTLSPETHLFEQGIVDSIGVLMLVQFLEQRFQFKVEPDEMVIDNFASMSRMAALVERKAHSSP